MQRAQPILPVIQETKEIFDSLGLQMIYKTETPEQTWYLQRLKEDREKQKVIPDHLDLIKRGNLEVDAKVFKSNMKTMQWMETKRGLQGYEWAKAMQEHVEERKQICQTQGWEIQGGITMNPRMVQDILQIKGQNMQELSLGIESGTGMKWCFCFIYHL